MSSRPVLSAVLPVRDEAENLAPLHAEIVAALDGIGEPWEIVYVDDGSTDASPEILARLALRDDRVRFVPLVRRYGQSTAVIAGAEAAQGEWIATLDADGQNDPADLQTLWRAVRDHGADVATGVRTNRADSWIRRASSWIANAVRNRVSGDRIADVGCSLRIMPREPLLCAVRFEGMHRFLPTLLRMQGCRVVELPVGHRPRRAGKTKYGIHDRLWRGLADLLVVRRLRSRRIEYAVKGDPSERPDAATRSGAPPRASGR